MRVAWFLFSVSFFCCMTSVHAQTGVIRGRVIDAKSLQPLPFANVYFNQTTAGTVTNEQGEFVLMQVQTGTHELIASYVGYKSFYEKITILDDSDISINIRLVPSQTNLKEIQVKSVNDKRWHQQLNKFKTLFLGTSESAAMCKIFNPWVLEFAENDFGSFEATALEALEIENLALGYKITYQLGEFKVTASSYSI